MDEADRCDELLLLRDGRADRRRDAATSCARGPAPSGSTTSFLRLIEERA